MSMFFGARSAESGAGQLAAGAQSAQDGSAQIADDELGGSGVEATRPRHRRGRAVSHLRRARGHLRGACHERGHAGVHLVRAGVELQHGGSQRGRLPNERKKLRGQALVTDRKAVEAAIEGGG